MAVVVLSSCNQATEEGALVIPDNQAMLSLGQDGHFPLLHVEARVRNFTGDCPTGFCLYWHDGAESAYFELALPQMSGTFPLSDSRVQLSYDLMGRSFPLQSCAHCTGGVAIAADVVQQSLHVTVDGTIGVRSTCKVTYCQTFADPDAFTVKVSPCDGGTCFSDIPCNSDGTVHLDDPAEQFCANPDYQSVAVTVKARATFGG